jgi:hypothetical protein
VKQRKKQPQKSADGTKLGAVLDFDDEADAAPPAEDQRDV